MAVEALRLESLLESVADGHEVDWDAAEAAADDAQRPLVRNLRLVAKIAEAHRTTVSDEASSSPTLMQTATAVPTAQQWGRLALVERIGEGAFGEVYRAHDAWLDRHVALKLLKPGIAAPARLVAEARALARVRHPNVVTVHGADMHDGRVGLWMELVHGRTLSAIVASDGPFSAEEATVIGSEVCRAVAAVHAAGLVHRDIKAQNVMREAGGRLVLMDFGAGHTPLYAAPELTNGASPAVATDIYAIGVLLYYLVTGRYPVVAASVEALHEAHARGERRRLVDERADLPARFVAVVERALDADPNARFATAAAMLDALAPSPAAVGGHRVGWGRAAAAAGVLIAAASAWVLRPGPPAVRPIELIAVLPFENVSRDETAAVLAIGVPMELTARLGEIGALRVVPWTSARRVAAATDSISEVMLATGADAVIEGAVQVLPGQADARGEDVVRVRVLLYRASTSSLLWNETYERPLSQFLKLQSDIARAVAQQVNAVVERREQIRLSEQDRPVAAEALEDYLKGREALEARQEVLVARSLFESAIRRDASFAAAHAQLTLVYALESAYVGSVPAPVALERATRAAERAIRIDPQMPEVYAARAFARMALAYDWDGAENDLRRALERGPESALVHDEYSTFHTYFARHDEAIAAARRAIHRAPMSAAYGRKLAWALYMARRYDDAIAQLRAMLDVEPGYVPALTLLGRAYALTGRHEESIRVLSGLGEAHEAKLGMAYALGGRRAEAVRVLERLTSRAAGVPVDPYELCVLHAALGNTAAALSYLRRAYDDRDPALPFILSDPFFDPLRAEPEFGRVVARLRLRPQ